MSLILHRIEERGSGFRRMHDKMIDHGLEQPRLATDTGYFQIIFSGPGDDLKRLRVPPAHAGESVPPSVEQQLNDRQKKMAALLVAGEELTSRRCESMFGITRPVTAKDFATLVRLGAEKVGSGRSTRYRLKPRGESLTNR